MKKAICVLLPLFFLFTIFFPEISFDAACRGLILWYTSLVPALFPVMILSNLLLRTGLAYRVSRLIAPPFTRFLKISPYGVYALFIGLLCGCPMGAKTLADMRREGLISAREASYLVIFCNNISPAFVSNFLVLKHLGDSSFLIPTLIILMSAPLLWGLFANHRYQNASGNTPFPPKNKTSPTVVHFNVVDACISDSIVSITKLGSYVILFSIIVAVIECLPFLNAFSKAFLACLLEVSNGIHISAALPLGFELKYLVLISCAAFGGLCCTAQSFQMLGEIGISVKAYFAGKLSVTAIAILMALCYLM